jgi:TonB family protein
MKRVEFMINSLAVVKMAVLVGLMAVSFSAMASGKGVYSHDRETVKGEIFINPEKMPQFRGGETALLKFLQENLQYPPQAVKDKVQGRVVVKFMIDKLGDVSEVEVVRSVREDLDAEAVRVAKMLPRFSPGSINGKAVSVWYTLPVTFTLKGDDVPSKPEVVEEKAEFPGGEAALTQFLKDNIKYPYKAVKNRVEGRVKMEFLVGKTGKVTHVRVVESVDKDLAREALRVCKLLPDFKPATVNGEPVEARISLPIQFKIPSVKHQYLNHVQIEAE